MAAAHYPGYLREQVFLRDQAICAICHVDTRLELSGDAFRVAEFLATSGPDGDVAEFSVTIDGLLVFAPVQRLLSKLVWRQRSGRPAGIVGTAAEYTSPSISPDGRRVAFALTAGSNQDIWIANRDGTGIARFTFEPESDGFPVWSPNGTANTFTSGAAAPMISTGKRRMGLETRSG